MSFILDALKKLEQKRQQDSVPNLSTIHTPNLHKPQKRPKWPYLLLIALLLNAGILTAWLKPWSSETLETVILSTTNDNHETASAEQLNNSPDVMPADAPATETVSTADDTSTPLKPAVVKQMPSVKPAEEPAAIVTEQPKPVEKETASTESTPEEQIVSLDLSPSVEELVNLKEIIREEREFTKINTIVQEEPSSEQYEDKPERDILELSELPAEVRKEIPDISINGHIYSSNSSSRLTNINGSLVREGDTVTGQLKVKEITMTGVIFDYEGLRFRVRAF